VIIPAPLVQLIAGLTLLVALVFGIIVQASLQTAHRRGAMSAVTRQSTILCAALSLLYVVTTIFAMVPGALHVEEPPILVVLYVVADGLSFLCAALFWHLTQLLSSPDGQPRRRWVVLSYAGAALMTLLAVSVPDLASEAPKVRPWAETVKWSYILVMLSLTAWHVGRNARGSGWRPGSLGTVSRSDFWTVTLAAACILTMLVLHFFGSWAEHRGLLTFLGAVLGLIIAIPFAARSLGAVLAGLLMALGLLGASGLALGIGIWLGDRLPVELRFLAPVATMVGLLLALGPGQPLLQEIVERVVFRRSRQRRADLLRSFRRLSPALGCGECSHRALAELVRVLRLRGAALLLSDGTRIAAGDIDAERIARRWPSGSTAERLFDRPHYGDDDLPPEVHDTLTDEDILGVVPVLGSSRFWGHLLLRTDLVTTIYRDEDTETVEVFADQLAVLLDAADILTRAVAMERSLAHSEKLAALGELAARIVHDIRNPITAAKSLSQQLSREEGPDAELHGVIDEELDRVERRVSDLLRFARRDELSLEPVDLAALVRETVGRLRGRLDGAGIAIAIEAPRTALVSADREKIRHVLINLIENSVDALAGHDTERRIMLAIVEQNGTSRVEVSDNGPGIPPESLEHVFDPFFSSKADGTGLGLAIVKRTVEAHGGRIDARPNPGSGISFIVELPAGRRSERLER